MQYSQVTPTASPAGDHSITQEIKESTFRTLVTTTGAVLVVWYLLASFDIGLGNMVHISFVLLTAGVGSALAYFVASRSFSAARAVFIFSLLLACLLALYFFQQPDLVFFLSLLPMLAAAITFHWEFGLLAEAGIAVLFLVAEPLGWSQTLLLPGLLSLKGLTALLLGSVMLIVGHAYSRAMLQISSWSMINYHKAREELESIREERVHLLQVQEDFALANKELARLTERLGAMTQIAEEARRVKEDFVARVSHELRTPLNMIIGFSEMIMKSPQVYGDSIPSPLLADVDAILRNSHHLSRLVDDILDLSQVEAGRMALTKEWTSVEEVIDEAVSAVRGLFDSKGLYLRETFAEKLPHVFCDSTRIRQVIINLLGNAARYTDKGGVAIRVWTDQNELIIGVKDTGPGIASADQKRIFEPFQQVDGVLRRHKGGTGLGLTISKQFVEMHGGKMWVESEPGVGSEFFFSLPVSVNATAEGERGSARRWFNPFVEYEPRTHLANLPVEKIKPRFVVVEREDNVRRLFTRYSNSVELICVNRIDQGVSETQHSPAQALVLNTPESLDDPGIQASLSGLPFGTPVFTCWLPGKEEAARRLGVIDYLVKPVSLQEVLNALEKVNGTKKVLVVDDEPEILRLLARMLSSTEKPYSVIQAMNGIRALQLLRTRKPDMMLLDLVMPEMDGFQVLQEKSQDPAIRDIPVVVISSINPSGESSVSRSFSVARGTGLSAHELLSCIQSITKILNPEERVAAEKEEADSVEPGES